MGGEDVVGVADIVEEAARLRAEAFDVPRWETDYRALVEDPAVEAVVVTTPALVHAEVAIHALRAGKHVFCEKPMARTVADAKAMVDAERESGLILQVGYVMRYSPSRSVLAYSSYPTSDSPSCTSDLPRTSSQE